MSNQTSESILEKKLPFARLTVRITRVGEDYAILLYGGEKPHIGCTVLAVPRPSLDGSGKISSTASVLNVTGHKDEVLCRYLAEKTAAEKHAVTVCAGGVHTDALTEEQISEIVEAVKELGGRIP